MADALIIGKGLRLQKVNYKYTLPIHVTYTFLAVMFGKGVDTIGLARVQRSNKVGDVVEIV